MSSVHKMTVLVLVIMILGFFLSPAAMLEVESETRQSGDYTYFIGTDSTAEITRYTGEAANLIIPGTLDGYKVTGIGDDAFASCKSLIEMVLPEGLERIGDRSFKVCQNLKTISMPDTVVDIGEEAFSICISLIGISLPKGLTRIRSGTFSRCDSLLSVILPDGLISIGHEAFHSCDSLASIALPKRVKVIGEKAFYSCNNLRDLILPEDLISIGKSAFAGCSGLSTPDLPAGLRIIEEKAFALCKGLTSLTLPEGLEYVGTQAFYAGLKLNSIALPASVNFIGSKSFDWCPDLTLTVGEGSFAETWAKENAIPYMFAAGGTAGTSPKGVFSGDRGSKENPVLLSSVGDLLVLQARVNSGDFCEGIHFRLTQDIVLNEGLDLDIEWTPLKTFNGTLDGDGHAVTGMYVTWRSSSGTGSGFIGELNGLVKNLTVSGRVETPQGSMEEYKALAGGICAKNYGIIDNCASYVTFYDNDMFSTGFYGGISGRSLHGTVMNCVDNSHLFLSPKYWGKYANDSTRDLQREKYTGVSTFSLDEDPVFHRDYLVRNNCVDNSRYMGIGVPVTWNNYQPGIESDTHSVQTSENPSPQSSHALEADSYSQNSLAGTWLGRIDNGSGYLEYTLELQSNGKARLSVKVGETGGRSVNIPALDIVYTVRDEKIQFLQSDGTPFSLALITVHFPGQYDYVIPYSLSGDVLTLQECPGSPFLVLTRLNSSSGQIPASMHETPPIAKEESAILLEPEPSKTWVGWSDIDYESLKGKWYANYYHDELTYDGKKGYIVTKIFDISSVKPPSSDDGGYIRCYEGVDYWDPETGESTSPAIDDYDDNTISHITFDKDGVVFSMHNGSSEEGWFSLIDGKLVFSYSRYLWPWNLYTREKKDPRAGYKLGNDIVNATNGLNLREEDSANSKSLKVLANNERVCALESDGIWTKVLCWENVDKAPNSNVFKGYVSSKHLASHQTKEDVTSAENSSQVSTKQDKSEDKVLLATGNLEDFYTIEPNYIQKSKNEIVIQTHPQSHPEINITYFAQFKGDYYSNPRFNPSYWPGDGKYKNGSKVGCTMCVTAMTLSSLFSPESLVITPEMLIEAKHGESPLFTNMSLNDADRIASWATTQIKQLQVSDKSVKYLTLKTRNNKKNNGPIAEFEEAYKDRDDNWAMVDEALHRFLRNPHSFSPPVVRIYVESMKNTHSVLIIGKSSATSYRILDTSYWNANTLIKCSEEEANYLSSTRSGETYTSVPLSLGQYEIIEP